MTPLLWTVLLVCLAGLAFHFGFALVIEAMTG